MSNNGITVKIKNPQLGAVKIKNPQLGTEIGAEKVIEKNHAELINLDYEHSGHTGFQKAGDYVTNNELINKGYVISEPGKGLSTNDFTDGLKSKLDGIETGATKITVEDNLTSTSTTNALSAKQGKILKGYIDEKQATITSENKLNSDLISDTNQNNKFVTSAEKTQIANNTTAISNIKDGTNIDSFGDVETALNNKVNTSLIGANSGIAELDSSGKVPSSQLPSYVDDVINGYYYNDKFYSDSEHTTETTAEDGKIYIDKVSNKTYRWSGTAYVEISPSLALGETSSTAYRGDRGKIAYEHSQSTHARIDATKTESSTINGNIKIDGTETTVYTHPSTTAVSATAVKVGKDEKGHVIIGDALTKTDIGLGNVGNFKAVSTETNQGLTATEQLNARNNIGAGTSNLEIGTTSTTASAGNHTHSLSMETDTNISQISLSANTKYKLSAGGSNYVFTTPQDTTYESKNALQDGTDISLVTTGEKYIWNNKSNLTLGNTETTASPGNHTHTTSLTNDTGTSTITLSHGSKYKLTAGGSSVVFTTPSDNNTTYSFETGDNNGQIKVTPSEGNAQNISVKGLGSNAFSDTEYLPLTGGTVTGNIISTDTTGRQILSVGSNNKDTTILRVYSSDRGTATTEKGQYGYSLKYLGSGSGNNNKLQLLADNQTATDQKSVVTITNDGKMTIDQDLTTGKINTYTLAGACAKGVDTNILDGSTSTNLPTSKAVADFVEGKGYMLASQKGVASGVAELDSNGLVPSSQLPSYVDDVLEYTAKSSFPATGETGKIYVDTTTNLTYRWSGSAYTEISPSLALGETSSTAYRGDRGKIAYDHSQSTHARTDATKTESSTTNGNIKINGTETTVYTHPTATATTASAVKVGNDAKGHVVIGDALTKTDIGLSNVGNFKAVSTVASQGLSDTEKSNARANIGAGTSSLTLGTSSSTAYRGDRGNTAYSHATDSSRLTTATSSGLYKVASTAQGHIASLTAIEKTDITGLGIPAQDTTYSDATISTHGLMSTADKTKLNYTNIAYGTCTTDGATAEKTITVSGNTNWDLETGSIIVVFFSNKNTANNPTFKVNGKTAKNVYYGSSQITTSNLDYAGIANAVMTYVYDGTQFRFASKHTDANTTYTNVKLGQGYGTCTTAEATVAKTVSLSNYELATGGIVTVKFSNNVPASSTLNVNSKGAKSIYYKNTAITNGVIKAGDTATFIYSSRYHLIAIDRWATSDLTEMTTSEIENYLDS